MLNRKPRHRSAGFTLIEIMVVMFIISVMCAFGYSGLNNTIKQSNQISVIRGQLEELQLAVSLIQQDLTQTVNRNIINDFGSEEHALLAQENSAEVLKLSRAGWSNPAGQRRSTITRIEWLIDEDNNLVRRHWYELDRAPGAEPVDTIVLTGIESVEMNFLDRDNNWEPLWPNINNVNPKGGAINIPKAAEVIFNTERWGEVRRVFQLFDLPIIPPPDFGNGQNNTRPNDPDDTEDRDEPDEPNDPDDPDDEEQRLER